MHMGIPVCKRAGIAKKNAYGDPTTHNEVVRIRGLTCIRGDPRMHMGIDFDPCILMGITRSDWLTPW